MKKKALLLNSLIVVLEAIGLVFYVSRMHTLSLEYYTMDSNILALITSLLFLLFYGKEKEWIKDLRLITTCALTITFLVVIFILTPMLNFRLFYLLFGDEMLVFHTLCPILSFISYVFYEDASKKKYLGFCFTMFYALVLVILNLMNIVDGPYPFLRIKEQSIYMTLLWGLIIIGGSYFIGLGINKLNQKIKKSK